MSCSDRVLKQGEDGNAGRAKLQFHSRTSVVISIVSQYKLRVPIETRENRNAGYADR